jgi:hypothetical protein
VQQAVAAAEVAARRHVPVTPVEGAAWLNALNQEMWTPFIQPFLVANNLNSWQVRCSATGAVLWHVCVCVVPRLCCGVCVCVCVCACVRVRVRVHGCANSHDGSAHGAALSCMPVLLLQDTVSAAAPRGWQVEIADVNIGSTAPQMSGAWGGRRAAGGTSSTLWQLQARSTCAAHACSTRARCR